MGLLWTDVAALTIVSLLMIGAWLAICNVMSECRRAELRCDMEIERMATDSRAALEHAEQSGRAGARYSDLIEQAEATPTRGELL